VREHIARADLTDLMLFLRVGEPVADVREPDSFVREPGGTFTEWGWLVGECFQFQSWQSIKDSER